MKVNTLTSGTTVAVVAALAVVASLTNQGLKSPADETPPQTLKGEIIEEGAPVLTEARTALRPDFSVSLLSESSGAIHEEGGDIEFCVPLVFPEATCLTRDRILKLDGRPIDRLTPDGAPRFDKLLMVHPTDFREPEREVRTCEVFARLKSEEWGAMTTAGMATEARFERYCGLMALARVAQPARTSRLSDKGMTEAEIESVPGEAWPHFGERFSDSPIFSRDEKDERRWNGNTETLLMTVQDIAVADFDDDGFAERLLVVAGRARGGSAGFSSFMLFEHDDQGVGLRQVVWE